MNYYIINADFRYKNSFLISIYEKVLAKVLKR